MLIPLYKVIHKYMQEVNNLDPLIYGSFTILHTKNTFGDKLLNLKLDISLLLISFMADIYNFRNCWLNKYTPFDIASRR